MYIRPVVKNRPSVFNLLTSSLNLYLLPTIKFPLILIFAGYFMAMNMAASLFSMMLIAVNRYILMVRGRASYNKIYTKLNVTLSILIVSNTVM